MNALPYIPDEEVPEPQRSIRRGHFAMIGVIIAAHLAGALTPEEAESANAALIKLHDIAKAVAARKQGN